jgi:hypothetical protein
MGEFGFKLTIAAMLTRSLLHQGRVDDANFFAEVAGTDEFDEEDATGIGFVVGALVAAHAGNTEASLRLAERAAEQSSRSDYLRDTGDRFLDLADVLRLAGRHADARAALERADELYLRKGCVAALTTTARLREELGG